MIRVVRPLERHPSLTVREFAARHAAYAQAFRAEPALRRYVRFYVASTTVLTQIPGQPPRKFDGLCDLWFDDERAYTEFLADRTVGSMLADMSQALFARANTEIVTVERTPLIDGGQQWTGIFDAKRIRMTTLLRRNPALTFSEFVDYHRQRHAPLFASAPIVKRNVRRYAIAHRANGVSVASEGAGDYDGAVDFWFDNLFDLVTTFLNPYYLSTVRPDERRFLDLHACDFIFSRELAAS